MNAPPEPEPSLVSEAVERVLDAHSRPLLEAGERGSIPREARDAAKDFAGAYREVLEIGRQLARDLAELRQKQDLLPAEALGRLEREAKEAADLRRRAAERDGQRAYARLRLTLEDTLLPALAPRRERLARDEAALALSGGGDPAQAARQLAQHGSAEALAALLSGWGETLLRARGVENPTALRAELRKLAVERALRESPDAPAAELLREHVGRLGAVIGSASSEIRRLRDRGIPR